MYAYLFYMRFKFWKKEPSIEMKNHKLIIKERKGGKSLEREKKRLYKIQKQKRNELN